MGSGAVVAAARRDRAQVVRRLPPGATQQPGAWSRLLLERDPLKGLILESPYLSVLRSRTGRLPAGGLVRGILRGQDMFDNREGLRAVGGVPLLVLAGTADEVIPADQARKLHSEYAGEDKSLLVLPGAGHNNLGDWPYATFLWPRVRRFVHRLSPAAAPGLPYIARLPAVQVTSEPVEEAVGDWAIVRRDYPTSPACLLSRSHRSPWRKRSGTGRSCAGTTLHRPPACCPGHIGARGGSGRGLGDRA